MNIIAFDTASEYLDIALSVKQEIFIQYKEIGLKHSEYLIPNINELCDRASIKIQDIDLIICTRGPGSFTGLRIGMAAAKGIAYGLQIPLISVPTLDVYAEIIKEELQASEKSGIIIPVIDAKKQRFYCALYSETVRKSNFLDIAAIDLFDTYLQDYQDIYFSGPDAGLLVTRLRAARPEIDNKKFSIYPVGPISVKLLEVGLHHFQKNGPDSVTQGPLYLRSST